MKTLNAFLLSLMAIITISACSDDKDSTPEKQDAINLIMAYPCPQLETTYGVILLKPGTNTPIETSFNCKYVSKESDHNMLVPVDEANAAMYPSDGSEVSIFVYTPHNPEMNRDNLKLPVNIKEQDSFSQYDLLISKPIFSSVLNAAIPSITFEPLTFHMNIAVVGVADAIEPTVTITNASHEGVFSLTENKFSDISNSCVLPLSLNGDELQNSSYFIANEQPMTFTYQDKNGRTKTISKAIDMNGDTDDIYAKRGYSITIKLFLQDKASTVAYPEQE